MRPPSRTAWGQGLYAVTPETATGDELIAMTRAALEAGSALVQYRNKSGDPHQRLADAGALLAACHEFGAPLIVNDDVELARAIGAHGVHLGRDDAALPAARDRLGAEAIIGVSCYDQLPLALAAHRRGASYVAFGSFFPSTTKPGAVRASLALLEAAKQSLDIPIAAIGGINADNAGDLLTAGADLIAVVDGVFGGPDVAARARALVTLFAAA